MTPMRKYFVKHPIVGFALITWGITITINSARNGEWISVFTLATMCVGITMQAVVVYSNGCKMPVIVPDNRNWNSDLHCAADEKTQFRWLADRFHIGNHMYSLGDLLIFASFGVGIACLRIKLCTLAYYRCTTWEGIW